MGRIDVQRLRSKNASAVATPTSSVIDSDLEWLPSVILQFCRAEVKVLKRILIRGLVLALMLVGASSLPALGDETEPTGECYIDVVNDFWCSGCVEVGPGDYSSTLWFCRDVDFEYLWVLEDEYTGSSQGQCIAHANECVY